MGNCNFGTRLKNIRNENKMTRKDLADRLNLAVSTIGMYERGERNPNFEILEHIADIFNVDIDYLLCKSDIKNKYQFSKIKKPSTPKKRVLTAEQEADLKYITENNVLFFKRNNLTDSDIEKLETIIKDFYIETLEEE